MWALLIIKALKRKARCSNKYICGQLLWLLLYILESLLTQMSREKRTKAHNRNAPSGKSRFIISKKAIQTLDIHLDITTMMKFHTQLTPKWKHLCYCNTLLYKILWMLTSQSSSSLVLCKYLTRHFIDVLLVQCSGSINASCAGGECNYNASWVVEGDSVTFMVSARTASNTWVGIGFSDDQLMVSSLEIKR